MTTEELLAALEQNPVERLKWRVLSAFGVLPGSKRAKELSDEDYIVCGAHMVLDAMQRISRSAGETAQNAGFDDSRYKALSEDET